jgi:hypothetical protein
MRNSIFVVICLILSITITAQVTIVEITESQAISLLDSLKRNNIGHTHTKQWSDNFVNIEDSRIAYLRAIVGIHQLVMPDQIDVNKEYNRVLSEFGTLHEEVKILEEKENKDASDIDSIKLKSQRLKYIEEVEFINHPYVYVSKFERSIEEFYDNLNSNLGDTVYVYASGIPQLGEYLELDENKRYIMVSYGSTEYALNTISLNFGIICNRTIEGQMYANRWK